MDDEALPRAGTRGDRDAFAAIVTRHQDELYTMALRILGTPADAADVCRRRSFALRQDPGASRPDPGVALSRRHQLHHDVQRRRFPPAGRSSRGPEGTLSTSRIRISGRRHRLSPQARRRGS